MTMTTSIESTTDASVARVNGVALHRHGETLPPEALRQRACTELLRQAAQVGGLLAGDEPAAVDGVLGEAASNAIETLLEDVLRQPEPTDADCRRYFEANRARFRHGERARLRHVLFAVTAGVDVAALRKRAEATLLEVRCHDGSAQQGFAAAARTLSNCPSGAAGGELGWLGEAECAPEFAREVFGHTEIGVLPRLVLSRFGLHVVEVLERDPGREQEYGQVCGAVRAMLARQTFATALRQYLQVLASEAALEGVDLDAAQSPLVQ